ncbi:MAG: tyrosine-protein kinase family protein [Magnetococcales bacterium]|nr:tyrosine-protein kinase family protein [Magnetococcales bacterium]
MLDFERLKNKGIITPDVGRSAVAEEYRVIKRPLLLNATDSGPDKLANANMIMVTSAFPKEGKTFTAINLAMSLAAEMDFTVVLVDGDVAKPSVSRILGFKAKVGLIDHLLGKVEHFSDVLIRTNVPKLMLLPSGRRHHHATELLASENMRLLLKNLGESGPDRLVVFDSPPLLVTTEASELARNMGQIVMVVEAERTPQAAVKDALQQLENLEIVGVVLNKTRKRSSGGYYYYGYGGYGGYGSYGSYGEYGNYGGYGGSRGYSGQKKKKSLLRRIFGL